MVMPPNFKFKVTCEDCGYVTTFKPASDAIIPPTECSKCGSDNITHEQMNSGSTSIFSILKDIVR